MSSILPLGQDRTQCNSPANTEKLFLGDEQLKYARESLKVIQKAIPFFEQLDEGIQKQIAQIYLDAISVKTDSHKTKKLLKKVQRSFEPILGKPTFQRMLNNKTDTNSIVENEVTDQEQDLADALSELIGSWMQTEATHIENSGPASPLLDALLVFLVAVERPLIRCLALWAMSYVPDKANQSPEELGYPPALIEARGGLVELIADWLDDYLFSVDEFESKEFIAKVKRCTFLAAEYLVDQFLLPIIAQAPGHFTPSLQQKVTKGIRGLSDFLEDYSVILRDLEGQYSTFHDLSLQTRELLLLQKMNVCTHKRFGGVLIKNYYDSASAIDNEIELIKKLSDSWIENLEQLSPEQLLPAVETMKIELPKMLRKQITQLLSPPFLNLIMNELVLRSEKETGELKEKSHFKNHKSDSTLTVPHSALVLGQSSNRLLLRLSDIGQPKGVMAVVSTCARFFSGFYEKKLGAAVFKLVDSLTRQDHLHKLVQQVRKSLWKKKDENKEARFVGCFDPNKSDLYECVRKESEGRLYKVLNSALYAKAPFWIRWTMKTPSCEKLCQNITDRTLDLMHFPMLLRVMLFQYLWPAIISVD